MVESLFLAVPRCFLRFVIVVFPDHTHILFYIGRQLSNVVRSLFCLGMIVIMLCFCSINALHNSLTMLDCLK